VLVVLVVLVVGVRFVNPQVLPVGVLIGSAVLHNGV